MADKMLWNDGWSFVELPFNEESYIFPAIADWTKVDIPHDWMIYNTHDLYRDSIGWYKKDFTIEEVKGHYALRFDGVYMDTTLYVNGHEVLQWKYGYSMFEADITDYIRLGKNHVALRVVYRSPNTRWYSGAGMFRNVWFKTKNNLHMVSDGIYVTEIKETESRWRVETDTELAAHCAQCAGCSASKATLKQKLFDAEGNPVAEASDDFSIADTSVCSQMFYVENPKLWDIAQGNLYRLVTELWLNGRILETEEQNIGFRTLEFNKNKGFFINGRNVKINGVCEHHDLGCLGAAFRKPAMRRKLLKLREMGVNAIRTSHNMPAKELMELCDELGFLVDSEAFDMWESSKTEYDYGRFFNDWYQKDVASWVRRDRNHASLIMWSLGNEIPDTMREERGQEIICNLRDAVMVHDPKHHVPITHGSNYMKWECAQGCAGELELQGYNYAEYLYDEHHEKNPDWVIYGSETASVLASRGIYHFPREKFILSDTDEHCSALGNTITGWGAKSYDACITDDRDAEYSLGQFIWTGFDYIGEPTPYQTKNCYFGQLDTAGFPKDSFYIFKSAWDKEAAPFVHLFPYWDFNEGQMIDVQAATNAASVELLVNGRSMGVQHIDHEKDKKITCLWKVPYEKGYIRAVAYDKAGTVVATEEKHSFGDTACLKVTAENTTVKADGEDLAFVEISAFDTNGYPVENARNRVHVEVEGAGRLLGLDNGDSTDFEAHKGKSRRLFGGKLLAVIGTKQTPGIIKVTVTSPGLPKETIEISAVEAKQITGISCVEENTDQTSFYSGGTKRKEIPQGEHEIPVRKVELICHGNRHMTKQEGSDEKPSVTIEAKIYPENATYNDLQWKAITDTGIEVKFVTLHAEGNHATVIAEGDGEFFIRCAAMNGSKIESVQSTYEFVAEGIGEANFNPYEMNSAGLFDYRSDLVLEGIEHGVNFMGNSGETMECVAGFTKMDFGDYGTDKIILPIFANTNDPVAIQIWEGHPKEAGSICLYDGKYHKPAQWLVFQPETYTLNKRVKGVTSIYIATRDSYQLKGIVFEKQEKAFAKLAMTDRNFLYGDSFTVSGDAIEKIGNNVTIGYETMDFGAEGVNKITICSRSPLAKSPVQIRFKTESGDSVQVVQVPGSKEYTEQSFAIETLTGCGTVEFIFLPGSNFDFAWFKFEQ